MPDSALTSQMWRFAQMVAPDAAEAECRRIAIQRTFQFVSRVFPTARMELTGSTATGLTLPTSDIDLVLFIHVANSTSKNILWSLYQLLDRHHTSTAAARTAQFIPARVPIITWVDAWSGLSVDLSANSSGGVHNTAVARSVLSTTPALWPLLVVLKAFLQQHDLHKTKDGGLGSYLLFVMAEQVCACMCMCAYVHDALVDGEAGMPLHDTHVHVHVRMHATCTTSPHCMSPPGIRACAPRDGGAGCTRARLAWPRDGRRGPSATYLPH